MSRKKAKTKATQLAKTETPDDIMALTVQDIAGDLRLAAHVSSLAVEARKHLPKWMGRHPRVPGNNASAEVTEHGTLLHVNEITMQDLPGYLQWLSRHSGIKLTAMLDCGHPATALVNDPVRNEPGVIGESAEPSTNVGQHCSICAKLARADAAIEKTATLSDRLQEARNENKALGSALRQAENQLRKVRGAVGGADDDDLDVDVVLPATAGRKKKS